MDRRPSFVSALLTAAVLVAATAVPARAERLRVCTFRYNASDELDVLTAALSPEEFEFVELTPTTSYSLDAPGARESQSLLLDRCRPDLRCDVLVFTGEFAGRFFGTAGTSPSLQELEEAACQARCAGLFHAPQEVFLLACNTLATKDPDERTPERYRDILLDHGFDDAAAAHAVELRYGPLGPSIRQSFQRIFKGVPRIYGFASPAPIGEFSAPLLRSYFARRGDYRAFLQAAWDNGGPNQALHAAFAGTSMVQTAGLTPADPAAGDRDLVCALYDESQSVAARLQLIDELAHRDDFLAFVPTVQLFLRRHPPGAYVGLERSMFRVLQAADAARAQVLGLLRALDVSTVQLELAQFARQMEWISREDFRQRAVACARALLQGERTSGMVDAMCAVATDQPIGGDFALEDVPEAVFADPDGMRLVACLSPVDARLDARFVAALDSPNPWVRSWAAYALTKRLPLSADILGELARHRDAPSADVRERVRWILTAQPALFPARKR